MDAVTIRIALTLTQQAAKHWKKIVIALLSFCFLLISGFMMFMTGDSGTSGTAKVNEKVAAWKPVVVQYAEKYGIPDYVEVVLAIMMIESGGNALDIMQSSESLGLPPNSITDPVQSIDVGVKHLSKVIKDAKKRGLDYWTPVQSYNYGMGFNTYIAKNGKAYTFELASSFSSNMANGKKVGYSNPIADFNGNYRFAYGNMYYVMLVQQYLSPGTGGGIGNVDASALGPEAYQSLMNEVTKYNGWGYVWGGSGPSVGFDCSGLIQYAYNKLGFSLPRTAAQQSEYSIPVLDPQPGDLVFFKGTNSSRPASAITHVGIYVDENRMYDANNGGIGFSNWNQGYWKQHFAGFGRVVK